MTCLDQSEASIGPEPVEADEHDQGLASDWSIVRMEASDWPEPVEADEHDEGLDEELGEEEPEEGLEIMEHSVELNELSQ